MINNPKIDKCPHIFCTSCYETYVNLTNEKLRCPVDGIQLTEAPKEICFISNILEKQLLNCGNKEKGCEWSGQLKDYFNHLKEECIKQIIKCPFEECEFEIEREKMEEHKLTCEHRKVECEYCHNMFNYNILKEHESSCPKFKVSCPQQCQQLIPRDEIEIHLKDNCPNTLINCSLAYIGCNSQLLRKDIEEHSKNFSAKHTELIGQSLTNIIKDLSEFKNEFYEYKKNLIDNKNINEDDEILLKKKRMRNKEEGNDVNENMQNNIIPRNINNSLFDLSNLPLGATVNQNSVSFKAGMKPEHRFVFSNLKLPLNVKTNWKVNIKHFDSWVALGLCDKKKVLANKMKFYSSGKGFNHGSYLISTNNYSWNCNNTNENNLYIKLPQIQSGIEFCFEYDPNSKILNISSNKFSKTLTRVEPIIDDCLVICIVFLNSGNEVELIKC